MTVWPIVSEPEHDLGDIPHLAAEYRPFRDFQPRQDPALDGRPPLAALKPCCGEVLANEECDCQAMLDQLKAAPVIRFEPRRKAA